MTWLRLAVAALITVLWAAGVILSFTSHTFHMPDGLTPAMLLVAGWLFGRGLRDAVRRNGNGNA